MHKSEETLLANIRSAFDNNKDYPVNRLNGGSRSVQKQSNGTKHLVNEETIS